MIADPFATEELRARVLAAWTASPARFREDANAEEDLSRGAYRDRVVVELAQNAADAATRAGIPGHLRLRLADGELVAANTGVVLDADAVESLSTLRASTKRDAATSAGRFGVGFAAVMSVSDEPAVISRSGAVRWSRQHAYDLAAGRPALADELDRRGDAVPVLRLPLAGHGVVDDPYDTVVRLPLRDRTAVDSVRRQLDEVDDAILLTLPSLAEVVIDVEGETRVLRAVTEDDDLVVTETSDYGERVTRWRRIQRTGRLDDGLLTDRPVEERDRPWWSVLAAVPVDAEGVAVRLPTSMPRVLHAPTPSDEPLSLPALLVASVPLDPTRRHAAPGPLRDYVLDQLAEAYVDLLGGLLAVPSLLDLMPPALASGEVDAELGRLVLHKAQGVPLLPAADGTARLRPADAVVVPGLEGAADPPSLGRLVVGLVHRAWWRLDALRRLGVRERPLADLVDEMAGLDLEPTGWRELYAALDGSDVEALGALPVPLADGRVVRGPRGALVPESAVTSATWDPLTRLGVRIVHPDAAHPLLARLGAQPGTPAGLLRHPVTRQAVQDGDEVTDVVLTLVDSSGLTTDDEPWLGELLLTDVDGRRRPAGSLFLPGSPVLAWLEPDEVLLVSGPLLAHWGREVLVAVGVRGELGLARDGEFALDGQVWHDLDDEDGWLDAVLTLVPDDDVPPVVAELVAVRDLDLVRPAAWPDVLALLAQPPYREAILTPTTLRLGDGRHVRASSYTQWWLSTHVRVDGRALGEHRAATADAVVSELWEPLRLGIDAELAGALGVRTTLSDLLATRRGADELLDRLADPLRDVPAAVLRPAYDALASANPEDVAPPDRVRVPRGTGSVVVAAAEAVVAGAPFWAQLPGVALLPAAPDRAEALADVLDLALAHERFEVSLAGEGRKTDVPELVGKVLTDVPSSYLEHDDLRVAGHSVAWWVAGGTVHACTLDGLARGLAWASGHWPQRFLLAEALRDPAALQTLLTESAFEGP